VDQVGEQRHAPGEKEDERLRGSRGAEQSKADQDRAEAGAGAENRPVDKTVGVAALGVAAVIVEVGVRKRVSVLDVVAQEISPIRSE
jgi:predicted neutral ceramidase superfamily lipid hydrolase